MYDTFKKLQDRTAYLLNFNKKQVDGDFTTEVIQEAINSVYEQEWNRVLDTSDLDNTTLHWDTTWPGAQVYFPIPAQLLGLRLYDIVIVESDNTETQLVVANDGVRLSWLPLGPESTLNIRFKFAKTANEMVEDTDQPVLFPKNHREFLAWAAAIQLKQIADQNVPGIWVQTYNELRGSALKATDLLFANQPHQYHRRGQEFTDFVNFDPQ